MFSFPFRSFYSVSTSTIVRFTSSPHLILTYTSYTYDVFTIARGWIVFGGLPFNLVGINLNFLLSSSPIFGNVYSMFKWLVQWLEYLFPYYALLLFSMVNYKI